MSDLETTRITTLDSLFVALPTSQTFIEPVVPIIHEDIFKPSISIRKLNSPEALVGTVLHTPVTETIAIPKTPTSTPIPVNTPIEKVVFTAPSAPKTTTIIPTSTPKHIVLPASPKEPNLVTGVVVNQNDKLIENAIVQIVSSDGIPARAMKTNSLGQFYTSTPLGSGTYIIEVDKEGIAFTPQQIIINNTILSPIELRATS